MRERSHKRQKAPPDGLWTRFSVPGPIAQGYLQSAAEVAVIIGPVGSAKTSTSAAKMMLETCRQHPSTKDGVRRACIAAIRHTYIRMHDTLTPSLQGFFGNSMKWSGDKKGALDGFMRWHENGEVHELSVLMRCFQDQSIESFVRGFQVTSFLINEFDELPAGTISMLKQRAGRYALDEKPDTSVVPPAEYCKIFGDCNMPDFDSWVHEGMLKQPQKGVEVYIQPSGFAPNAENLHVLQRINPHYYENMAQAFRNEGREADIKRFIENKPGYTAQGRMIYPEFVAERHIADGELVPDPFRPLMIGVDQGGQAAAVICQSGKMGQLRVLDEVVLDPGVYFGGVDFGRLLAMHLMEPRFRRFIGPGGIIIRTDPAALQRHGGTMAMENDERSWYLDFLDGFLAETGLREQDIDIAPAPTNVISQRHNAVKRLLSTQFQGTENFITDKRCRRLNRGFVGGYRRVQIKGTEKYHKDPYKDQHADVHDALQYIALDVVPEFARTLLEDRDPHARVIASQLMAQRPQSFADTKTKILM